MKLQDKIDYEFQCFYLDMMRTSKENIFAHSEEIVMKKKMLDQLQSLVEDMNDADEDEIEKLMLQNNLLESFYCFWKDVSREDAECNLEETMTEWQKFLIQRGSVREKQHRI